MTTALRPGDLATVMTFRSLYRAVAVDDRWCR
jgi:hypothetical protein